MVLSVFANIWRLLATAVVLSVFVVLCLYERAEAVPIFARQYGASCRLCHAAYPRLNSFGEEFVLKNMKLPNWKEAGTVDTGDERLALPKFPALALRTMAYTQVRQAKEIDPTTGPTDNDAELDFQGPYMIKLFSAAPLSEHISYYFYGIFAEKGSNGETVIEDAWFRHDDILSTGIALQIGQFQVSDLMFPRELRLTFQDYMVYRMAGITYDRGIVLDRRVGHLDLAIGAVNGNGISQNFNINSPGYRRPDHMFDNDRDKSIFGRIGTEVGPVTAGVFALAGKQKNITSTKKTDKVILGIDLSGNMDDRVYWFFQALWNRWEEFIKDGRNYEWYGGFAGLDYIHSEQWVFSLLYNYADAGDLDGTKTVYEGIDINSLTLTASYYFMTNLKGIIEGNVDFLGKDKDDDYVGHETKEGYILVGFDAAF